MLITIGLFSQNFDSSAEPNIQTTEEKEDSGETSIATNTSFKGTSPQFTQRYYCIILKFLLNSGLKKKKSKYCN